MNLQRMQVQRRHANQILFFFLSYTRVMDHNNWSYSQETAYLSNQIYFVSVACVASLHSAKD